MPAPDEPSACLTREEWKRRVREARHSLYVHCVGIPYDAVIEPAQGDSKIDHVWMMIQVPPCGLLRLSINTLSLKNREAGFDPRVYMAIVPSRWEEKPTPTLRAYPPMDYAIIEAATAAKFTAWEADPLETFLIKQARLATRIEAWGELYIHNHLGIHQLHSRRASSSIASDHIGRDGGLKFYYPDHTAEFLMIKFHGQA